MNSLECNPILTVYMLSYNHEKYLDMAISSVIMQETSFKFNLIIHDDASTDGSREIIARYKKKFPDMINVIYQKENKYSKGENLFLNYILPFVNSKYLAVCEGDDFWIDKKKLQKQINFLESNHDFIAVGHNVKFINDTQSTKYALNLLVPEKAKSP